MDENTSEACLPLLLQNCALDLPLEILEINSGEEEKTIETVQQLWSALTALGADRKSVLLNLGGGVITDLGGFLAATYKRGIDFYHIPTTLLGMVDASIGGKTGIDFEGIKNQIGVFQNPKALLIYPNFLETLEPRQMRSGLAEMYKHGLIADERYWNQLKNLNQIYAEKLEELILTSVQIKTDIVASDPTEAHSRKGLNFGHTIGHAVESYFLENKVEEPLLHGEAIAVGMVVESYLSYVKNKLDRESLFEIRETLLGMYEHVAMDENTIQEIQEWLKHDKKNKGGRVNFVLLNGLGSFDIDQWCDKQDIDSGFNWYLNGIF